MWPEVFALDDPSQDDFAPVVDAGLYTADDVDRWRGGDRRVRRLPGGIDEAGHRRFFVAGD